MYQQLSQSTLGSPLVFQMSLPPATRRNLASAFVLGKCDQGNITPRYYTFPAAMTTDMEEESGL